MSRGRAYQLIRFVQDRHAAATGGKRIPSNERQSRGAELRTDEDELDSFEQYWIPIYKYLENRFRRIRPVDRRRFVKTLETVAASFSYQVQKDESTAKLDL
jgi:hypothetical protein